MKKFSRILAVILSIILVFCVITFSGCGENSDVNFDSNDNTTQDDDGSADDDGNQSDDESSGGDGSQEGGGSQDGDGNQDDDDENQSGDGSADDDENADKDEHDDGIVLTYENEIHVYSSFDLDLENGGYLTINEAIDAAEESTAIYVHEGIYREEVKISNKNNIGIIAYGDDEVYVTATEVVDGFTDEDGDGIYEADVKAQAANLEVSYTQLFTNGETNTMARFPNQTIESSMEVFEDGGGYSYLTNIYRDDGDHAYVTFDEDVPDVDLTGAIFKGLIGKNAEYPVGTVVSNDGNVIGFDSITSNEWTTGAVLSTYHKFGFGYLHHKNLIDIEKEWYLEDDTMYYMPPNDCNIDELTIEMQVRESVLTMSNSSDIEINGIEFYGGNGDIRTTDTLVMRNSSMQYMSGFYMVSGYGDNASQYTGIYVYNSENLTFINNYIGHTFGNAFYLSSTDNSTFTNCVIEDIGAVATFTSGIYSSGGDLSVENCTFNENGRFQIRIRGDGQVNITDSVFNGSMKLGEDAGPIEMTSTGSVYPLDLKESVIAYNIISDVRGIPVSGSSGSYLKQFVKAFYMEDVENYTAHHNIVHDIEATESLHMLEEFSSLKLESGFIYLGPRFNELTKPVNYYNNTAYNYDTNINIWHIQIDNYEDLNLEHDGGALLDGSFINNALEEESFSITYNTKELDAGLSGSFVGSNLTNANGWSNTYTSTDFDEFAEKLDEIDYHLNPQNNILLDETLKTSQYVDAQSGDFTLASDSVLKNSGIAIDGITEEGVENPDCGALEGSDRVLNAGSSLTFEFNLYK